MNPSLAERSEGKGVAATFMAPGGTSLPFPGAMTNFKKIIQTSVGPDLSRLPPIYRPREPHHIPVLIC